MLKGILDRPEEFEDWIMPRAALAELTPLMSGESAAAREIEVRLKVGAIIAIAGSEHRFFNKEELGVTAFEHVAKIVWDQAQHIDNPKSDFWWSGRLEVNFHNANGRDTLRHVFLDIRFYPHSIAHIPLIKAARGAASGALSSDAGAVGQVSSRQGFPNLSVAEMRRFADLYVGIWKDAATEVPARTAALACYPDNNVPRDAFREIFREFREKAGPVKPGRPRGRGNSVAE